MMTITNMNNIGKQRFSQLHNSINTTNPNRENQKKKLNKKKEIK